MMPRMAVAPGMLGAQARVSARRRAVIVSVLAGSLALSGAKADSGGHEPPMAFDLPAQPLETALERFMTLTRVAVMVDSAMVAGRMSGAVKGSFSPEGALRALLVGTGLDPRPIAVDAYTLAVVERATEIHRTPRFVRYAAAIQQAVAAALCRQDRTRPTHYRAVMRLWINPQGMVERVQLAGTTGDDSLDAAIGHALRHIEIGAPAPDNMPQPVKLAIVPRSAGVGECAAEEASGQARPELAR